MHQKKTETNEEIKETSKPTTAKERVKIELDELTERNEKLKELRSFDPVVYTENVIQML